MNTMLGVVDGLLPSLTNARWGTPGQVPLYGSWFGLH